MKNTKHTKNKTLRLTSLALLCSALFSTVSQGKNIEIGDGWNADIGLQLQAFGLQTDNDSASAEGQEDSFRVMSGFDPSKLTIGVSAPEINGLKVSGTYQIVSNITSGKSEGGPDGGNLFGVRIAEIAVEGKYGTVKAGRGWQIMGSSSLIHNSSSLPGVGGTAGGACGDYDGNDSKFSGGCGLIGYGYVWTNFASGFQFASQNYDGFSYRVGIFEPLGGSEADSARFEGEVNYSKESFDLWASFVEQDAGSEGEISAFDVGGEVRFSGFALTAAYTDGTGIDSGFRGPSVNDTTFYYIEGDYTFNGTMVGVSVGHSEQENPLGELTKDADITTFFIHHNLTDSLKLVGEWVSEEIAGTDDISHLALGAQLTF